jgi:predicted metal-dependent peptidase
MAASRVKVTTKFPYLASIAFALRFVPKPGIKTMSADYGGRLFYDPDTVVEMGVDIASGTMMHELWHLLDRHKDRKQSRDSSAWNLATDFAVNQVIIDAGLKMKDPLMPRMYAFPEKQTPEAYYDLLMKQQENQKGKQPQPQKGPGAGQAPGGKSSQKPKDDEDESEDQQEEEDQQDGDPPQDQDGDSEKSEDENEDQQDGSGDSEQDQQDQQENSEPPPSPGSDGCRCGGCAGNPNEWEEEDQEGPQGTPRQSEADMEVARMQAAQAIAGQPPGSVPSMMRQWAESHLEPPKVDWRKRLRSLVRRAVQAKSGANDYTRSRPSRRYWGLRKIFGKNTPVLPSMINPVPTVKVVVDKSGSMHGLLEIALAEVLGIAKAMETPIEVMAADVGIAERKKVSKRSDAEKFLVADGGTDMRIGIREAAKDGKCDVIILLTDGYTPWPTRQEMPRQQLIVGLVGEHHAQAPDHIRDVVSIKPD